MDLTERRYALQWWAAALPRRARGRVFLRKAAKVGAGATVLGRPLVDATDLEVGEAFKIWSSHRKTVISGWAGELAPPAAVLVTTKDRLVPPRKQRALADALGVEPHLLDADHDACSTDPVRFVRVLQDCLRDVGRVVGRVRAAARPA